MHWRKSDLMARDGLWQRVATRDRPPEAQPSSRNPVTPGQLGQAYIDVQGG